jgi:hypothetical protein
LTREIGLNVDLTAAMILSARLPSNETKFQVVAVAEEPGILLAPAAFPAPANEQSPTIHGGSSNQPAQLSRGPNSERQPITPLSATAIEKDAPHRPAANRMTSADLLSSDAPARYRQASPVLRQQMRAEYQAAGLPPADLALLDLYATASPAALAESVNALPQRADVDAQLWLRQFGMHPDSSVRRMAWSWLITSSDRSTKQWLAERAATDSDGDLREWYQSMTKQKKLR